MGDTGATGATGVAETETVTVTSSTFSLSKENSIGTGISCPADDIATGGGISSNEYQSGLAVMASYPEMVGGKPEGWDAYINNPNSSGLTITFWAVCEPGS